MGSIIYFWNFKGILINFSLFVRQSSKQYWEHFTYETLEECEKCRQRSVDLRSTLDDILMTAAKELRHAADQVEGALKSRINCITECVQRMENDLRDVSFVALIDFKLLSYNTDLLKSEFVSFCYVRCF